MKTAQRAGTLRTCNLKRQYHDVMRTDDAMMRAADDNMRADDDMIAHDDLKTCFCPIHMKSCNQIFS